MYGTKEEAATAVLISMESGSLISMIILGTTGAAIFSLAHLTGFLIPFFVGFVLGNMDKDLRRLFSPGTKTLIPFLICTWQYDQPYRGKYRLAWHILLAVCVVIISGISLLFMDIYVGGGKGTANLAASNTTGAAVATPTAIAQLDPDFLPVVASATALVATCVVVTSILVTLITGIWAKKYAGKITAKKSMEQPVN